VVVRWWMVPRQVVVEDVAGGSRRGAPSGAPRRWDCSTPRGLYTG